MRGGVDDRDLVKRDLARARLAACWERRCGCLSTQVLNEFHAKLRKEFSAALSTADARAEGRRYQNWRPWVIDPATIESAWAVESRCQLNHWDALMVAAAQHQGCHTVLTEDLQHDRRIDTLRVVNPFILGPGALGSPA